LLSAVVTPVKAVVLAVKRLDRPAHHIPQSRICIETFSADATPRVDRGCHLASSSLIGFELRADHVHVFSEREEVPLIALSAVLKVHLKDIAVLYVRLAESQFVVVHEPWMAPLADAVLELVAKIAMRVVDVALPADNAQCKAPHGSEFGDFEVYFAFNRDRVVTV